MANIGERRSRPRIHTSGALASRIVCVIGLAAAGGLMSNAAALAACAPATGVGTPSNATVTCSGSTTNQDSPAGYGTGDQDNNAVNVLANASVTGDIWGFMLGAGNTVNLAAGASVSGDFIGMQFGPGTTTLVNSGTVAGNGNIIPVANGIVVSSGTLVVSNAGVITGTSGSVPGDAVGINASGADVIVSANSGSITANATGSSAIALQADNVTIAANSGSITANANGQTAIAINVSGSLAIISNSGTIAATGTNSFETTGINVLGSLTISSNTGLISGASNAIVANTATITNNAGGTIAGGTGIFLFPGHGPSDIFNAGTITGSGGTAIQFSTGSVGNSLTLAPGFAINGKVLGAGADVLQLAGTGSGTFDVGSIGAGQQYQGFSTFNKVSASTWTITGTGNQAWTVAGGTFLVDGTIGGAVNVTAGTLAGVGAVGATTINSGGVLAPGSGIAGTSLTIAGNLAFASGAMYLVQLNQSGASFANVTGTATLGGTVLPVFTSATLKRQYDILHSAGLGGTTFSGVNPTGLPPGFAASLSYSSTDAFLNLTVNLGAGGGLSINQQHVATSINNFFNSGGTLPQSYLPLFALSGSALGGALGQLSGESAVGSQQTTFQAMTQFMGLLTDPFMARGNAINGSNSPTGYAEEDDAASAYAEKKRLGAGRDAYAMFTKAPLANVYEPRWSVWASAFGGTQTTDGNAAVGSNSTTSRIAGTAVGADYLFSPNTLAGFALAGGGTSFSVNNLGSGRSDLFQAGAYLRHTNGAAYITAALAYGWQDITTNRTVTIAGFDQLRAEFNANAWSGRLEGGYRFVAPFTGGIGFTPYAAAQFTTFDLPAYAESVVTGTPNFALSYGARSVTDARSELGFRTDKSFAMANGVLTLRSRFAWAHDYDPDRSIAATFQALPGASFAVNGPAQASDSALTTASAEMKWMNGWSAAATFEGEFSNVTSSYAGKGVVRYQW
ncbi:autotransporter outer membrane beta-barrel domain-containing protein [Bradyrhizobium genosp. A]|uniref:autotransporter outer membrane beta-barrel domain-containing protein n=1 Tax=Bradyrhizobium genosp. A TaxID=83626 RepID=UPI003CEA12D4